MTEIQLPDQTIDKESFLPVKALLIRDNFELIITITGLISIEEVYRGVSLKRIKQFRNIYLGETYHKRDNNSFKLACNNLVLKEIAGKDPLSL